MSSIQIDTLVGHKSKARNGSEAIVGAITIATCIVRVFEIPHRCTELATNTRSNGKIDRGATSRLLVVASGQTVAPRPRCTPDRWSRAVTKPYFEKVPQLDP
jgi:hypothetical protein